jgi:hypothetical protein
LATKRNKEVLLRLFIEAAKFRNKISADGRHDNVGAIYSASRILDILGLIIRYDDTSHHRNIKRLKDAECSAAVCASKRKDAQIEHVQPLRALTVAAIEAAKIGKPNAEKRVEKFVKENYRLVLLTKEERKALDRRNRTKIDPNRLRGVKMCPRRKHLSCEF